MSTGLGVGVGVLDGILLSQGQEQVSDLDQISASWSAKSGNRSLHLVVYQGGAEGHMNDCNE